MLCNDRRVLNAAVQDLQRPVKHQVVVWRVEEYTDRSLDRIRRSLKPTHDVSADDAGALHEAEYVQVLAQDSKTTWLVGYEGHAGGTTRQCLNAERSRSREQIQNLSALDAWANQVENGLLYHTMWRPDALGSFQ